MDDSLFAGWTRFFSRHLSRRRLGGLAAGALGAFGLDTDVGAKKKRRGKKKRKKRCRGGATRCGKTCVNTRTSATHCGGCNQGCSAAEVCLNGACSRYRFVTAWGSEGEGDEQFLSPNAIAVDGDGNVYGVDTGNHRVQKFAPDDQDPDVYTHAATIGGPGDGDGEFNVPAAVDVDGEGNVFVADLLNHRIQKFAPNAQNSDQYDFVTAWGSKGTGNGEFDEPLDLEVDADGNVFVVDFRNSCIQKFAPVG